MSRKNRLAAVGLAAGLLGGGAAGIALTSPGIASGQTDESTPDSAAGSTTTEPGSGPTTDPAERHGQFLEDTLAPLVEDGTITQAQADAVIKAIEDARPEGGGRHFFMGRGPFGDVFSAAAEAIGVDVDDLRSALRDGQTIAEIAAEHDVEVGTVVDAMVAAMKADLDEAVANERLTQEQADGILADAEERLTALVNGEGPKFEGRPRFEHRFGGPGMFGGGEQGSDDSGSGDSGTDTEGSDAETSSLTF
jgi:hypothetical protein